MLLSLGKFSKRLKLPPRLFLLFEAPFMHMGSPGFILHFSLLFFLHFYLFVFLSYRLRMSLRFSAHGSIEFLICDTVFSENSSLFTGVALL